MLEIGPHGELPNSRTLKRVSCGTRTVSANFQDLHSIVEIGGTYQCDAAALQGYGLHLHAIGHHGNGFMTRFVGETSLSPVLLELKVTHVQNTAEQHITLPGAGRSHDWDNLSSIFPELLRSQKDIAELRERN